MRRKRMKFHGSACFASASEVKMVILNGVALQM